MTGTIPSFWETYADFGYFGLYDGEFPNLHISRSDFDGFSLSDGNGFNNSLELPSRSREYPRGSPDVDNYYSTTNRPLPPISTFFENTRRPQGESLSLMPSDELLAFSEMFHNSSEIHLEEDNVQNQGFTCEFCGKVLPSKKSLKNHDYLNHEVINKSCSYEFCTYVSKTRKEYNTHIRQHNLVNIHEKKRAEFEKRNMEMNVSYTIRNQKELEIYLKTCSDEMIDKIHQNQKDLLLGRTNIPSMNLYIEFDTGSKKWSFKYTCIGCSKDFARDYNARRHSERHSCNSTNPVLPKRKDEAE